MTYLIAVLSFIIGGAAGACFGYSRGYTIGRRRGMRDAKAQMMSPGPPPWQRETYQYGSMQKPPGAS